MLTVSALVFGFLWSIVFQSQALHLPPIYWNSSSETFTHNSDYLLTVRLMDSLDIHCPFYNDTVTQDEVEYLLIYSVSKKGYDECYLDGDAHAIVQCHSPFAVESVLKLVFREFSPTPNAVEFVPGQTYYWISTSDGTLAGLRNRKGGLCERSGMKMKVKVEDRDTAVAPESDGRKLPTKDDDVGKTADDNPANVHATGRTSTLRKEHSPKDGVVNAREEIKEDEGMVDVKFIANDNELIQSTPASTNTDSVPSVEMDKRPQSDGRTNTLIYDPYGIELHSGSIKRDQHSSQSWRPRHQWHGPREGRTESREETPIVLYEIHEIDAQNKNRYEATSSSASAMNTWYRPVIMVVFILAVWRIWSTL